MLRIFIQFSTVAIFSCALSVGAAHAQWSDDEGGEDEASDEAANDAADDAAAEAEVAGASTGYPREYVLRPIQLYPGMIEAGVDVKLPTGPDFMTGDIGLFNWMSITLHGYYGVTDDIQAGLEIPLGILSPDSGSPGFNEGEFLGGFIAHGYYSINEEMSGMARLGLARPGMFAANGYWSGIPPFLGDLKFGFGLGGVYKKRLTNEIAIVASPELNFQADAIGSGTSSESVITLHLPVSAYYQLMPDMALGVHTGLYTGDDFSFDADELMTIPFILAGMYTLMDGSLDVGGYFGLGSLTTPSGVDVADTLFIGVTAAYRMAM